MTRLRANKLLGNKSEPKLELTSCRFFPAFKGQHFIIVECLGRLGPTGKRLLMASIKSHLFARDFYSYLIFNVQPAWDYLAILKREGKVSSKEKR